MPSQAPSGRRSTAARLAESESRWRAVVEKSFDLICELDDVGKIGYAGPGFERILGYSQAELHGKEFESLLHPDDKETTRRWLQAGFQQDAQDGLSARLRHRDGPWISMEGAAQVFEDASGAARMVIVARDLSQKLLVEEELLHVRKLESLEVLAGGIAHDFNNILTAILLNISTAAMDVDPEDEEYLLLDQARKSCQQASDLAQQLLTFSKRGTPVKKTISIAQLIRDTIGFALRGSALNCEYDLPVDLWPVNIDEVQIGQVLNNIVTNALQAMPDDGNLQVACSNVSQESDMRLPKENSHYVRIAVFDHGPGIPEEHLPRIFEPYFSTRPEASGLGLSTAYAIVRNHAGVLQVESQVGKGTEVFCYLPAVKDAKVVAAAPQEPEPLQQSMTRVLVMDDDAFIRNILVRTLTRMGYQADASKDGDEAVALYRKAIRDGKRYAAVILDLTVPGGKGGRETARELRALDGGAKVIITSGYLDDPVLHNHQLHGFAGALRKPFEIREVRELLCKTIGSASGGSDSE